MKLCFLCFLLLILFTTNATVKRSCKVKYKTEEGWSKDYLLQVQFMTGRELKKAVNSNEYRESYSYALIWFEEGQVAIIELSTGYENFGEDFDPEDFRKIFSYRTQIEGEQVNNKRKTEWEIQGKDYGGFIDKRVDDE